MQRVTAEHLQAGDLMPYEKFKKLGPKALTERELIAIILRTGTREKDVLELAGEVLALSKTPREGLLGLYDVTLEELMGIKGIGEVKAVMLKCLTELSMRISRAKTGERPVFNSPNLVAQYFMESLRHKETECVLLACLDTKGRLLCEKKLSDGSVRMSFVSPRQVFLEALHVRAVNIILVHNHPSGDPTPSRMDKEITHNLYELGQMMDILLLDHVIIGDNCYYSFKEQDALS